MYDCHVAFSAGPDDASIQHHLTASGGKRRQSAAAECLASQNRAAAQTDKPGLLVLVVIYLLFPSIIEVILIIQPETLVCRRRSGFQLYWVGNSSNQIDLLMAVSSP